MLRFSVRVTFIAFAVLGAGAIVACSDSTSPAGATRPAFLAAGVAALPIANATVQVIPGLDGATPTAINNFDEVVGGGNEPNVPGVSTAFRWDATSGVRFLPRSVPRFATAALALNDSGNVVGEDGPFAVLWLHGTMERRLSSAADTTRAGGCNSVGINNNGKIIGNCFVSQFHVGWIYDWPTHSIVLQSHFATMDGVPGVFHAVSNDGYIAGGNDGGFEALQAFILSPTRQLDILKPRFDSSLDFSEAVAVTYHGWAAGDDAEGANAICPVAVAWLAAPHQFRPEYQLGTCGEATGLTDDWYVVGFGTDVAFTHPWAFVWFPGPGLQRLPLPSGGADSSKVVGINSHHHAVGIVWSQGVQHVVIWKIATRPATL